MTLSSDTTAAIAKIHSSHAEPVGRGGAHLQIRGGGSKAAAAAPLRARLVLGADEEVSPLYARAAGEQLEIRGGDGRGLDLATARSLNGVRVANKRGELRRLEDAGTGDAAAEEEDADGRRLNGVRVADERGELRRPEDAGTGDAADAAVEEPRRMLTTTMATPTMRGTHRRCGGGGGGGRRPPRSPSCRHHHSAPPLHSGSPAAAYRTPPPPAVAQPRSPPLVPCYSPGKEK
uniref:Uncharacterized protein n=1 Tax=Oryza meridionalis TaxID=40149 RepID=A0A0E0DJD3_9ORYZ